MALDGMPDFQSSLRAAEANLLAPFGSGRYTLLPQFLEVAARSDGGADFHLGIVRGPSPLLPPKPYGALDFRLACRWDLDSALTALRRQYPGMLLEEAQFRSGFVKLSGLSNTNVKGLFDPVAVSYQGVGAARFAAHLDLDAALLLQKMLANAALTLTGFAQLELWGVAPRIAAKVVFDPAKLLAYMAAAADAQGQIEQAALLALFVHADQVPWEMQGKEQAGNPAAFAQCMVDHLRSRLVTQAPPSVKTGNPTFLLPHRGSLGTGRFEWDFAEPMLTARTYTLSFDPLESARKLVSAKGMEAVVSFNSVPPLQTGVVSLTVTANLPAARQGVHSLGVALAAPPNPPARPQQLNQTLQFQEPADRGTVLLQFSPKEAINFSYRTFAIVETANNLAHLQGKDTPASGDHLNLTVDDFPLRFAPVEASARLLAAASISGVLRHGDATTPFTLTTANPHVTLVLSGDVDASITVEAKSLDGTKAVTTGTLPARALNLDLSTFPQYGPQSLTIEGSFSADTPLLAIDLIAEALPENPANITTIALTPAKPKTAWTWFSESPFTPGYRYRLHGASTAWSDVLLPAQTLQLTANVLASQQGASA